MAWVIQTCVKNNNHWSDGDDAVSECDLCVLLWSSAHLGESVCPGISTWSGICHEWKTENERALCACFGVQQCGHGLTRIALSCGTGLESLGIVDSLEDLYVGGDLSFVRVL
ncbi:unnamed protein product [Choristocarpus tenellus]